MYLTQAFVFTQLGSVRPRRSRRKLFTDFFPESLNTERLTTYLEMPKAEDFDHLDVNESFHHQVMNFTIEPIYEYQYLQPHPGMITLYVIMFLMLESLGNFLLMCLIIHEKYGMDSQKRTVTNQLLSNMNGMLISFNISILPIFMVNIIFGPQSKYFLN